MPGQIDIKSFTIPQNSEQQIEVNIYKDDSKCVTFSASIDDREERPVLVNRKNEVKYCIDEKQSSDIFNVELSEEGKSKG